MKQATNDSFSGEMPTTPTHCNEVRVPHLPKHRSGPNFCLVVEYVWMF